MVGTAQAGETVACGEGAAVCRHIIGNHSCAGQAGIGLHRCLQQLAREMDAHAESLQAMLKETAVLSDDVDITLVKSLLRIPASSRGDAVTDAIDLYLARNGIEKVSYSKERAELFLVIPGTHEATVEPALVRADQVLSEGVACIKAEG